MADCLRGRYKRGGKLFLRLQAVKKGASRGRGACGGRPARAVRSAQFFPVCSPLAAGGPGGRQGKGAGSPAKADPAPQGGSRLPTLGALPVWLGRLLGFGPEVGVLVALGIEEPASEPPGQRHGEADEEGRDLRHFGPGAGQDRKLGISRQVPEHADGEAGR